MIKYFIILITALSLNAQTTNIYNSGLYNIRPSITKHEVAIPYGITNLNVTVYAKDAPVYGLVEISYTAGHTYSNSWSIKPGQVIRYLPLCKECPSGAIECRVTITNEFEMQMGFRIDGNVEPPAWLRQ